MGYVLVIHINDPNCGLNVHFWIISALQSSRIEHGYSTDLYWFVHLCLEVNCWGVWWNKKMFWDGDNWFIVIWVWGVIRSSRESVRSVGTLKPS
jgi:hypothetical protein